MICLSRDLIQDYLLKERSARNKEREPVDITVSFNADALLATANIPHKVAENIIKSNSDRIATNMKTAALKTVRLDVEYYKLSQI
jgi:hypothetical protein